ncbi:MAG: D-tyrosyl-tRNA(Tyr) deacylase [Candidatus Cloacimonetes bacterium]|jgi:D-tyrosyl-tRNA(Tyr) deacylase|nr:D-tyrosyl-tRNA(Tyr) deacylase [Candidatus Cloacimonadota bacterium]MBT4332788.1 D-tyrosyl-tRNA(Tyr) deacylase [Candidatus Cloacimonadota bacterium]
MKLVIQRVKHASVEVEGKIISNIGNGLLIFVGISAEDDGTQIEWLAKKAVELRIFEDKENKMNLSLKDVSGELLLVSQFTLYGSCKKGRRPDFLEAARPDKAENMYLEFAEALKQNGIIPKLGKFGEHMNISLLNDGPVTMILEK